MQSNNKFSRREFIGIAAAALLAAGNVAAQSGGGNNEMLLFVGTYTSVGKSEGIYVYGFNRETGKVELKQVVKGVADPSYLTVGKDGKFLFVANELLEFEGKKSGTVSAFAINRKTGGLEFLNKQPSLGGAPCFVTSSKNGSFALVANYLGGNVASFPVGSDGRLGPSSALAQHIGFGPNKDRQEAAHAHSITLDRNNRFAFAADLGIDRLMIYAFDDKTGKLTPNAAQPHFQSKPGAGPRHFEFHPQGKHAFLINELDFTITVLAYDDKLGMLKELQTVPTLPAGASTAGVSCADIHVSPDGRFVYGSNRGHNSIVTFAFDEKSGMLTLVGHTPTGGKKPRNFVLSPDGKFLLVANQDSDSVIIFARDEATGKLTATGSKIDVPTPVCLKFL